MSDGDYGHFEVFTSVSGVTQDTTPEEIDDILEQSKMAFKKIQERIRRRFEEE